VKDSVMMALFMFRPVEASAGRVASAVKTDACTAAHEAMAAKQGHSLGYWCCKSKVVNPACVSAGAVPSDT
jgi:hypothetical protein